MVDIKIRTLEFRFSGFCVHKFLGENENYECFVRVSFGIVHIFYPSNQSDAIFSSLTRFWFIQTLLHNCKKNHSKIYLEYIFYIHNNVIQLPGVKLC